MWWPADNVIVCQGCASHSHDATMQRGRLTLLVCNYCGLGTWVFGGPLPPSEETDRMKTGRFAGMTIYEIDKQKNGRRYLEHIAKTKGELCEVVSKYLAASQ